MGQISAAYGPSRGAAISLWCTLTLWSLRKPTVLTNFVRKDIVVYSFMKEQATLPGKTVIVRRKHDGPALANSIRFSISTPLCRPPFFAKGIPVAKAAQLIREVLRLQNLSWPKRRSPSRSNATARPASAAATLPLWPSNRRSDGSRARSALASRVQTAVNHTEAGRTRAARYGLQDLP